MPVLESLDHAAAGVAQGVLEAFPRLTDLMVVLIGNDFVKGGVPLAALWWFWAHPHRDLESRRVNVVATLVAAVAAGALSRALCHLLPYRARPIQVPGLGLAQASPIKAWDHNHGSFPSDHAALGFALATGLFLLSPLAGAIAFIWVAVLVAAPRVLLGIHWAGDVLGGAVLGMAVAWAIARGAARLRLPQALQYVLRRWPGTAYAALFLLSYGVVTRFDGVRSLIGWVLEGSGGAAVGAHHH